MVLSNSEDPDQTDPGGFAFVLIYHLLYAKCKLNRCVDLVLTPSLISTFFFHCQDSAMFRD